MAHVNSLYHNLDFIFNNPFSFRDPYSHSRQRFFADPGSQLNLRLFETNFIPDINNFMLDPYPERGKRTPSPQSWQRSQTPCPNPGR